MELKVLSQCREHDSIEREREREYRHTVLRTPYSALLCTYGHLKRQLSNATPTLADHASLSINQTLLTIAPPSTTCCCRYHWMTVHSRIQSNAFFIPNLLHRIHSPCTPYTPLFYPVTDLLLVSSSNINPTLAFLPVRRSTLVGAFWRLS